MFITALNHAILATMTAPNKMDSYWVEAFSKSLISAGLILSPQEDNTYHILTSVSSVKTPYLSFTMSKHGVRVADRQEFCVSVGGLAPQMAYRNRSVIRAFFSALTSTLDLEQMPCVLNETLTDVSSKYNQTFLQSIDFHSRELMTLTGVESNSKWIRMPKAKLR
jgi:hypothetical protein